MQFRSTSYAMEEFAKSAIWADLVMEIDSWRERILTELAAPTFNHESGKMDFPKDDRTLYDEMLRGSLLALDRIKRMPFFVAEIIEQENQEKENGSGA